MKSYRSVILLIVFLLLAIVGEICFDAYLKGKPRVFEGVTSLRGMLETVFLPSKVKGVNLFADRGWENAHTVRLANGRGIAFKNDFPESFMFVNANQSTGSYLQIEDNSNILLRFSVGEEDLRTGKLGNSRFALRAFSSSVISDDLDPVVYTEIAFVRDFHFRRNSIEVVERKARIPIKVMTLEMKIPFEKKDFELGIVPQGDGRTEVTVKDAKEGTVIGVEIIDFILFPEKNFLNAKIELGNQIRQIDINNFEVQCAGCRIQK